MVSEATVKVRVDGRAGDRHRRGQRPGQRAGRGAAGGAGAALPVAGRRRAGRLQGAHPARGRPRHRRGDAGAGGVERPATDRARTGPRSACTRTWSRRAGRPWSTPWPTPPLRRPLPALAPALSRYDRPQPLDARPPHGSTTRRGRGGGLAAGPARRVLGQRADGDQPRRDAPAAPGSAEQPQPAGRGSDRRPAGRPACDRAGSTRCRAGIRRGSSAVGAWSPAGGGRSAGVAVAAVAEPARRAGVGERLAEDDAVGQALHALDQRGGPPAAPLHPGAAPTAGRSRPTRSAGAEQPGRGDRVRHREVDPDPADRRHGVRGVADQQQPVAVPAAQPLEPDVEQAARRPTTRSSSTRSASHGSSVGEPAPQLLDPGRPQRGVAALADEVGALPVVAAVDQHAEVARW